LLIRLRQHRGAGIHHDLVARELHHFLRHVRIADHGFRTDHVLAGDPQVVAVALPRVRLKRPPISPRKALTSCNALSITRSVDGELSGFDECAAHFIQGSFCRLDHRDTCFQVRDDLLQSGGLRSQAFGNLKGCGSIGSTVHLESGGKSLQVLGLDLPVPDEVAVGVDGGRIGVDA